MPMNEQLQAREETEVRGRILDAAFAAFMENGYAAASTLEIATRARVSKRELYALVGNKQEMLIACINARASRGRGPAGGPGPAGRAARARRRAAGGARRGRGGAGPAGGAGGR